MHDDTKAHSGSSTGNARPAAAPFPSTWTADNGNGTYSNPLFYDEFSDPDMIRVDDDYYLTGTTMHAMPGLPVLRSRDLVNWEHRSYAFERLDLGPDLRLEDGLEAYGQGIWAPCLRHHNGRFYIFANVNGHNTQLFSAERAEGPWRHQTMNTSLHDLSVLFDDDGAVYVVWGYDELRMARLSADLLDLEPGSERVVVERGSGAGEGCHFYKIDGRYYIMSTNFDPVCYQVCLRADEPFGPYEMRVMSAEENLGMGTGWRLRDPRGSDPVELVPPPENHVGCVTLHQGGIVRVQSGEWWGWSMMDHNSVGRLTCLSPVGWEDGWPHFGLPGNPTRTPRTWVKPQTGATASPSAPYRRSDDFSADVLLPVWQWNHAPVDERWSLTERRGYLRLRPLPAESFWFARNSLTQRAMGPESLATVELDASGLEPGDVAGLALLNLPYAWIAAARTTNGFLLRMFDERAKASVELPLERERIWLRLHCDFDEERARFSFSEDGRSFTEIGDELITVFQLKTFQGVRYALFAYNSEGRKGGCADFTRFTLDEPRPRGLTRPIPSGEVISIRSLADGSVLGEWKCFLRPIAADAVDAAPGDATHFTVVDRGRGRIALRSRSGGFVTVSGRGGMAEVRVTRDDAGVASTFQWVDMQRGDIMLLSLATGRYLAVDPNAGSLCRADARGARPDRKGGACFAWKPA